MDAGLILGAIWVSPEIRKFPIRPELLELLVGVLAAFGAVLLWRAPMDWLRRAARRRTLWVLAFALLGPCIRLALLPLAPVPFPVVHDEFVHLLAAGTLLHGRLANPPLPLSDFFETIYVTQRPTYSATYPPGLAAFLAAGWRMTGHPWAGVWLAMVLCCGAVAWMLYRWLPPRAAWIGGLLCTLTIGISSAWMNTYYGGAVSAAGGALIAGSLPGLLRAARPRNAWILSAGWTLLWFTRPYESVILGLIAGAAIVVWIWRERSRKLVAAVLPIVAVVALDAAGLCYCNRRITGDPLLSPWRLTQRLYGVPHGFLWQREIPEPPHLTAQQQRIYLFQRDYFRQARSLTRCWPLLGDELKKIWAFYIGYPLTIPLAIGLFAVSRKMRALRFVIIACFLWSMLYPRLLPNYVSALTGPFFALASYGLLSMMHWRRWGAGLAICFCLGSAAASLRVLYPWYLFGGPQPLTYRVAAARQLEAAPGLHLVFVRYGPDHSVHDEWVYNRADPDRARVVWANDLGDERNRRLIAYFGGRHVWLAEPDNGGRVEPYMPGLSLNGPQPRPF